MSEQIFVKLEQVSSEDTEALRLALNGVPNITVRESSGTLSGSYETVTLILTAINTVAVMVDTYPVIKQALIDWRESRQPQKSARIEIFLPDGEKADIASLQSDQGAEYK